MATKDVKEFNGWFNRSYARLKERLSIYGKIDEDVFLDAYLAVRKQIYSEVRMPPTQRARRCSMLSAPLATEW